MDTTASRDNLERARARASERTSALARDLDEIISSAQVANIDDEHDPEGSTIAYERATVLALLAAAQRELVEIDAALVRAGTSAFGRCDVCGAPIGSERLEALPATSTCVRCAST